MRSVIVIISSFLVVVAGVEEDIYAGSLKLIDSKLRRKQREIRNDIRESRVLHYDSDESQDSRKMLLLRNRPNEPLHDMYRKGFSHLHVPDFHRQPVEERAPRRHIRNQTIDDIISGIIHLLGGDVHVTRPDTKPPPALFPSTSRPTRINDRGPAHFDTNSRRGRPSTTPASSTLESLSVIDSKEQSSTTERWVFPDDTDVSLILGLINDTKTVTESPSSSSANFTKYLDVNNNNFMGGSDISSGHLEIVEIVPSVESNSHYTLPTSTTEKIEVSSTTENTQIKPTGVLTGVLTELDQNGHTIIETVIYDSPVNATRLSDTSPTSTQINHFETTTRPYINYTDLPIILPSRTTRIPESSIAKDKTIPSGPITEWLPVDKPHVRSGNFTATYTTNPDEPMIITHQPDNFEITVTRQMYTNESKSVPEVVPTYTSFMTPADVTSSTDISVSIVATQVDVIYGRPSVSSVLPPPPSSPAPTGRPQVYNVNINEVRTSKRPSVYTRPRPPELPATFKNGLRPLPGGRPPIIRKPPAFRPLPPQIPEIRIDTCVVGDDSTCDVQLKEHCRTERGVSACLCRPGYGRTVERGMCSPVVSMLLTLKVAKLGDKSIDPTHFVPGSPEYQRLNYEASHAMSSIFTYSPLADAFRGSAVNRIYSIANRMVINSTVHLDETEVRGSLRHHVEHAVATSINRRDNRLGTSQLFINGPLSALVEVEDLNECGDKNLNDCSEFAICDNLFGTFQCKCKPGYTDKFEGDPRNAGRICSACSPDYCSGRGQCVVVQGRQECRCRGNYGGSRCQVDNEVIGVSVGVSVIAILVIAVTAACLYLWNRRWKRAHQKTEAAKHAGYRLQTMADHVRWGPTSTLGSTYVPSDSTMQLAPPPLPPSASQLYAISNIHHTRPAHRSHLYEEDVNPYGRIIRTLQKHNSMPSDSTMQLAPPPLPPSASQLYAISNIHHTRPAHRSHLYEEDVNPYGRIIRTLQKHNSMNHSGGLHYDSLNSECTSSDDIGFPSVPSNSFVYHGTFPDRSKLYR